MESISTIGNYGYNTPEEAELVCLEKLIELVEQKENKKKSSMKNLHVIPTDKSGRVGRFVDTQEFILRSVKDIPRGENVNIYITSDEEIKEGDWFIYKNEIIHRDKGDVDSIWVDAIKNGKKIILTTDQDLIADGVQEIDDEFLEWFVKNPSCENVEVGYGWIRLTETDNEGYWVSIPNKQFEMQQEEPKQETLEEAAYQARRNYQDEVGKDGMNECIMLDAMKIQRGFELGAKWQAERMYIEADKIMKFLDTEVELKLSDIKTIERIKWYFETYFEQFKKK